MKLYGGRPAKHADAQKSTAARKGITASVALLLVICLAIGGAVAFLVAHTDEIKNIFNPAKVTIETHEEFDGAVKKNVNVENTGDTDVYIRVKLVTYMQKDGVPTGDAVNIPDFILDGDWLLIDDTYYYTKPVASGDKTSDLIGAAGIVLKDGQVVEVLAEAIQAQPDRAVEDAWPVTVTDGVLTAKGA